MARALNSQHGSCCESWRCTRIPLSQLQAWRRSGFAMITGFRDQIESDSESPRSLRFDTFGNFIRALATRVPWPGTVCHG